MSHASTPRLDLASRTAGMRLRPEREYPALTRVHEQMVRDSPGMRADEPPVARRRRQRAVDGS